MNLTKQQVKAFLEVLSSDDARPILTQANIDEYEGNYYLVGTDSYKLAAIRLDNTPDNDIASLVGKRITREEITKWYKLASTKDYFTEENVKELAQDIYTDFGAKDTDGKLYGEYPKWQKLLPTGDREPLTGIGLNAKYMLTLAVLADSSAGLEMDFYGNLAPVMIRKNNSIYVIMPLKR